MGMEMDVTPVASIEKGVVHCKGFTPAMANLSFLAAVVWVQL